MNGLKNVYLKKKFDFELVAQRDNLKTVTFLSETEYKISKRRKRLYY